MNHQEEKYSQLFVQEKIFFGRKQIENIALIEVFQNSIENDFLLIFEK